MCSLDQDFCSMVYDLLQNTNTMILSCSRDPDAHTHQGIVKNTLLDAAAVAAQAPVHILIVNVPPLYKGET